MSESTPTEASLPTPATADTAERLPVMRWSKCPLCQTHRFEDEPHECVAEKRIREIVREEMSRMAATPADPR